MFEHFVSSSKRALKWGLVGGSRQLGTDLEAILAVLPECGCNGTSYLTLWSPCLPHHARTVSSNEPVFPWVVSHQTSNRGSEKVTNAKCGAS